MNSIAANLLPNLFYSSNQPGFINVTKVLRGLHFIHQNLTQMKL